MSHIPCRYLLAGAMLLASPAFALAQGSSGAAVQTAPGASIGEQVPIHGTSDLSTPSSSGSFGATAARSQATACGGDTAASGAGDMGTSLDSTGNSDCGIGFGFDDLKSLSILDWGPSSSEAIDVSKP